MMQLVAGPEALSLSHHVASSLTHRQHGRVRPPATYPTVFFVAVGGTAGRVTDSVFCDYNTYIRMSIF